MVGGLKILKLKNYILIMVLLLIFISLGSVSAIDDNDTASFETLISDNATVDMNYYELESSGDGDELGSSDVVDNLELGSSDNGGVLGSSESDFVGEEEADVNISNKLIPKMRVQSFEISPFFGKPWRVSVLTTSLHPMVTGNISVTINNNTYNGVLNEYGMFNLIITNYTWGPNLVKVTYYGDENYRKVSFVENLDIYIPDNLIESYYGNNIVPYRDFNFFKATGNITIIYKGISTVYNLNGQTFRHEFNNCSPGLNNYTIIYSGDDKYAAFSQVRLFTAAIKCNPQTIEKYNWTSWYRSFEFKEFYYGNVVPITLNLYDATGTVNFTINNKKYSVNLVNGIATLNLNASDYVMGINEISFEYSGDDKFEGFSSNDLRYKEWDGDIRYTSYTPKFGFTMVPKHNANIYSWVVPKDEENIVYVQVLSEGSVVNNYKNDVEIFINGEAQEINKISEGCVVFNFNASYNINEILVRYLGCESVSPINSSSFIRIGDNYIVNGNTYACYFNQNLESYLEGSGIKKRGGYLFDWVPEGATLDFQGQIIAPGCMFTVTKPVNIISSSHDALIDLNTSAGSLYGENPGSRFSIESGGSWSNVTGINFHNTQIWVSGAHHVILDNISNVVEDQKVGSGVGATSIRDKSCWITVKNSYFYTRNNGGSSSLVGAWANYCTFDNNTIVVEGNVGNMLYFTTYNTDYESALTNFLKGHGIALNTYKYKFETISDFLMENGMIANVHNNITNNKIYGPSQAAAICWGIVISGAYNLIENNTIEYIGEGITNQWSSSPLSKSAYNNIYSGNNLINGASMSVSSNSIVYDNYVTGSFKVGSNSTVYNNTCIKSMDLSNGCILYNNSVGGLTIGTDCKVYNSTINGKIEIDSNSKLDNNIIDGIINIKGSNLTINKNVIVGSIMFGSRAVNVNVTNNWVNSTKNYAINLKTSKNNKVIGNVVYANLLYGDDAVKSRDASNIVENNHPLMPNLSILADDIFVGEPLEVKVIIDENANGNCVVSINGGSYPVSLSDGIGWVTVSNLPAGAYDLRVKYDGDAIFDPFETSIDVKVSKFSPVIEMSVDNVRIGDNAIISLNIFGASGEVDVFIDGDKNTVTLEDGSAIYTSDVMTSGNHVIVAIYNGDERNNPAYASTSLLLKQLSTEITNVSVFDSNFKAVLKDSDGNPVVDANVSYSLDNGVEGSVLTDSEGVFVIKDISGSKLSISYNGCDYLLATKTSYNLDTLFVKVSSVFKNANTFKCYAVDTSAGESGPLYSIMLVDGNGNPITKSLVKVLLNDNIYSVYTNDKGIASLYLNLNNAKTYNCILTYDGDLRHDSTFSTVKIVVNKKKTSLTAGAKTFKVKTKTKKYTATLKTVKGSSADGKTYLKAGKKVTITVNKKTYTAKTNSKGTKQ